MTREKRLPSLGVLLTILGLFVVIMFSFIVILKLPIQLALLAVWFMIMGFGLYLGYDYLEMEKGILKGIYEGMGAILILIAVGALIGSWIAGGVVPTMIYYGLSIISPSIFLMAAMIICAVTAISTGTSFGSAGTAGIAMMGIGESFGLPTSLVAGAVISGCYVGDKMSPLSDTTVMTASLSKVELFRHIRSMSYVSVPAFIIAAIMYWIAGAIFHDGGGDLSIAEETMAGLRETFEISWVMLVPAVVVIVMLVLKMPSVPVILFGALLGSLWAAWFQGYGFIEAIQTLYTGSEQSTGIAFIDNLLNRGGITFMLEVILLIILALGVGGLLQAVGAFTVIGNLLARWANNTGNLTLTTMLASFFGVFFGGAAYVSLLTGAKITEQNYDRKNVSRTLLSRNVEAGGTVTTPMVPWSDGGVFMATTLGVATLAYLPFFWYGFLVMIISLIYGYFGLFIMDKDEYEKALDKEDSENDEEDGGYKFYEKTV
ncbi:MAG TPA: Na+/H+ antiporter NhaC [Candidatus Salinicoccus stercoripullorum]|uniref:Na+/H+ antiporter NhaC n=1 Tax=Candidatus Salinicoccus stercoripullorum TaxID=2838756 RepID=A0A9D1U001_9STAP|nr:Na+/H+ antiporter NhaC [Candidatus Salinicoccus stercoripullorum]